MFFFVLLLIHCYCWHSNLGCILPPPVSNQNHLLWSCWVFIFSCSSSFSFCCEILSLFIASVDLLYNQRKDNMMEAKHTSNDSRTKRNEKESVEGGSKTTYAQNFNVFIMSPGVLCPVLCIHRKGKRINKEAARIVCACVCVYLRGLCVSFDNALHRFMVAAFSNIYKTFVSCFFLLLTIASVYIHGTRWRNLCTGDWHWHFCTFHTAFRSTVCRNENTFSLLIKTNEFVSRLNIK